jgi:hypothetical protein
MREWRYDDLEITLQSGTEMGRFLLGSTVVMLFPQGALEFNPAWHPTKPLRMGEPTGSLAQPSPLVGGRLGWGDGGPETVVYPVVVRYSLSKRRGYE